MKSNPIYILLASPRSMGPSLLRWALAAALFLEIARTAFWAAGIVHWQGEPMFKTVASNLFSLLATPFAISRIVVAAGLLAGLCTRVWAFLTLVLTLLSYRMHGTLTDQICWLEYLLVLCGAALALMALGGGRGSLDKAISGRLLPKIG